MHGLSPKSHQKFGWCGARAHKNSLMCLHDRVRYERCRHLIATEPTTIQTLDSIFCRVDGVELYIDFTLMTSYKTARLITTWNTYLSFFFNLDCVHFAIFWFTFAFDIISKVFIPITLCFSARISQYQWCLGGWRLYALFRVKHVLQWYRSRLHRLWDVRFHSNWDV